MSALVLSALLSSAVSGTPVALGDAVGSAWRSTVHLSQLGRHREAEAVAQAFASRPEGLLLRAVVGLARFADLHDTASLPSLHRWLDQAQGGLEADTSGSGRLLRLLALSQSSYLASLEGRDFAAALAGRKAAALARELHDEGRASDDTKGVLGGYLFWKAQSLGALRGAFGGDTRTRGLAWTAEAAASESPLREAYRTSLLWMRFERGEYPAALQVARDGLAQNPGNRLYRQAEGDVLFRMRRYDEALAAYRRAWADYQGVEVLPVNRWAVAGNLARIHLAAGNRDSARIWYARWSRPPAGVSRWLPASLVREMKPVGRSLGM